MDDEKHICSICYNIYEGFGNNAQPVNNGRCCDDCNAFIVIPARFNRIKYKDLLEKENENE